MDLISIILILTGSIMVYGARLILKFIYKDVDDVKLVLVKFIGLIIAGAGFFKILGII